MVRSLALACLALSACTKNPDDGESTAPSWDEVGPILQANCTGCHNPQGAAPFSLTTYKDASAWAPSIADSVESRRMPPYLVTDDGTCGDWQDSRALSVEDIATITEWANGGVPGGKKTDLTPAPIPTLDRVDFELITPVFVPEAEGSFLAEDDEYRCFVFDNPYGKDAYITASEAVPGNAAIVHHVLAMPVDPDAPSWAGTPNSEEIDAMNGADGRDGWDCLGTAGGNIRERGIPVTWAPGQGPVTYPEGVGIWVGQDEQIIVQVHYNMPDPALHGQSDSTRLQFQMEDQVDKPANVVLLDPFIESLYGGAPESLPPGEASTKYKWDMRGSEVMNRAELPQADEFNLYGVMPHMHQRGAAFDFKVAREVGPNECAAEVVAWDFEWQLLYFYEEPIRVARDDEFRVTCTFDTTSLSTPVLPGWGTNYEMCLLAAVVGVD